jgi:GMP synthase-like glutamine amidotransferase
VKPVLLLENDPLLPGAGLLVRVLERRDMPWRVVQAHAGEADDLRPGDASAVVVLGGRQHAWEEEEHPHLRVERELLAGCVAEGVPALGCCLGGQILARACGGEVRGAPRGVHGWYRIDPTAAAAGDPLFSSATPQSPVYGWHLDEFSLPAGAVQLATGSVCAQQGFRIGNAWGVQFHPEADPATLRGWFANFPQAAESVGLDEADVHAEAERHAREPAFPERLLEGFADVALRLA